MLFSLDVVRARKGDCLILHYGSEENPRLMIIDGGPSSVYNPNLKPRLKTIKEMREIDDDDPLIVDLLMVSHVDDDHIQGILDMTRDLIHENKKFAQILSFWHNSFENVMGVVPEELTSSFTAQLATASTNGEPTDVTIDGDEDVETAEWSFKALASIKQGAQLRSDIINKLEVDLNPDFDGGLIMADGVAQPLDIGDGLTFTVVGPMQAELKKLHKKHEDWLKELEEGGQTPEDVLTAYVDKSVPNLSSIVVLAEAGDKSMLLTGDARGDKILKGLEMTKLVEAGGAMHVDILKVPHHGSANNLNDDFFERITADHYVFSGNGEHGNPERKSLEMLLNARGESGDYTIHLTYPIDEIDPARKADWEKEQKKEQKKKLEDPTKTVREDWSEEKHGLQSFFAEHPDFAHKVKIVEKGKAHVIDLLDEVGI